MLAGYRVFFVTRLASLLLTRREAGLKRAMRSFLNVASHYPGSGGKARMAMQCLGRFLPPHLRSLGMAVSGRALMPAWMNRTWFGKHEVAAQSLARRPARALGEHLEQALAETSLPMLLRYEDRNSMAYSIESRVPFLTPVSLTRSI